MGNIVDSLLSAPRLSVLRFLAAAINHYTVDARTAYGQADGEKRMRQNNETIHRLSSHLRDLTAENEPFTTSRAEAIVLGIQRLPPPIQAALESRLVEVTKRPQPST